MSSEMLSPELKQLLYNKTLQADNIMFNGIDKNGMKFISPVDGAMTYDPSHYIQLNLSPTNAISASAFTGNNSIQFRISPGYCGEIEQIFIDIIAKEGGGTNTVTPVPAPYLFSRIEIGFNGSTTPVQNSV